MSCSNTCRSDTQECTFGLTLEVGKGTHYISAASKTNKNMSVTAKSVCLDMNPLPSVESLEVRISAVIGSC